MSDDHRASPDRRAFLGRLALGLGLVAARPASGLTWGDDPDPDLGPWTRRLDGGGTVTLVGLSDHPSTDRSWWQPDGRPLREPPIDPAPNVGLGKPSVVMVVRFDGLPEGVPPAIFWKIAGSDSSGSWSPVQKDGRPVAELRAIVAGFPAGRATTTVGARIAAGEFRVMATSNPRGIGGARTPDGTVRFGRAHLMLQGTDIHTAVTVVHTYKNRDLRFVAVDDEGNRHEPTRASSSGGDDFSLLDMEFRVAPDRVREFEARSRPYVDLDFGEVPLKPKADP